MRRTVTALLLASASSVEVGAQGSGNPCESPLIQQALQRGASGRQPMLYDGVEPLVKAPSRRITFPADVPGGSCVAISVRVAERDGSFYIEDAGFMGVSSQALALQMRRGDYGRLVIQSVTQVVRGALEQGVFRARPQVGAWNMVAIPVVSNHPLYGGSAPVATPAGAAASDAPVSLAARGFPGSTLLESRGGVDVYLLGERGYHRYLGLVRRVAPDEPILNYVKAPEPGPFTVWRYGPVEDTRFRERIVPLLADRGERTLEVTIYHYGRGITIDRQPDSRFPWNNERHFLTGQQVEPPLAMERWLGRRPAPGGRYTWYAGGERGTSETDLNTVASIQKVQSGIAAQQQVFAANRAALFAKEAAELEGRRASARARDAERQRLVTAAGLLSLPSSAWERYALGPEVRAVFDGAWPNATSEWQFGSLYARTIRAFSNRCRRLIPQGAPMIVERWITRDQFGNERRDDGSDTTFILPAFAEPFRWWDRNDPRRLPLVPPGLGATDFPEVVRMLESLSNPQAMMTKGALLIRVQLAQREDMALLFEEGCESRLLKQFMENLRRLALRLPTLQQQAAPRAVLSAAEWPLSLAQACERHQQERGSRVGRDWCPCLEEQLGQRMTLGERWRSVEDYHTFFDEVEGFRLAPDGQPVWARYEPANACRR